METFLHLLPLVAVLGLGLALPEFEENGNEGRKFTYNFCSCEGCEGLGMIALQNAIRTEVSTKMCQAIAKGAAAYRGDYELELQLFSDDAQGKVEGPCCGVLFNAKDTVNYDGVWFHISDDGVKCSPPKCAGKGEETKCLSVGHVTDGLINVTKDCPCEQGKPEKNKWFTVKLEVRGQTTKVFLNNAEVANYSHYHGNVARGGAVLYNSYRGIMYFRGYNVIHLEPVTPAARAKYDESSANDTRNKSVGKQVTPVADSNVTTTAESGTMETSTMVPNDKVTTSKTVVEKVSGCTRHRNFAGFAYLRSGDSDRGLCRLLVPSSLAGDMYTLSVHIKKGLFSSSASGMLYNAQDVNNFDFFYYDFDKMTSCITTGTVQEGRMRLDGRRKFMICPPSSLLFWYNMTVHVSGKTAEIYINEKSRLTVFRANRRPRPQGGIVVVNGQIGQVFYKDFNINLRN